MQWTTFVMSCAERRSTVAATLQGLRAGGWPAAPHVIWDDGVEKDRLARITRTWRRMLRSAAEATTDYVLLLEDDIFFGRWFAHNLNSWPVLESALGSGVFFASLYNPGRPFVARRPRERVLIAAPEAVWGAQALVVTPQLARFIDANWDAAEGNPDQRMPRLASRVTPVYFHLPSLVDHAPVPTTWGGIEHVAVDFDAEWRAPAGPSSADQETAVIGS